MNKSTNQSTGEFSLDQPWAESSKHVLEQLRVSPDTGLSPDEIVERRRRFGRNRLEKARKKSTLRILFKQFESLIIFLLTAAAVLSFFLREYVDGAAISIAILVNTAIGFFTELRAVRSMEALQELGMENAKTRHSGQIEEIPAEKLVPGDIVLFEGGDIVPADIRLFEASNLQADESVLTGESVPVSKQQEVIEADLPLAARSNMLFKGTAITRGSGEGVVVATGVHTELGQIALMAEEAQEETTPLEKRLDRLGRKLIYIILIIAVGVGIIGVLTGNSPRLMFDMAIALAVAAIPEGLPIVATISLARGMWHMAQRNALINRLSAVETLGATNVICTDKTGTLTENRMTATRIILPEADDISLDEKAQAFSKDGEPIETDIRNKLEELLKIGALCNNASYKANPDGQSASEVGDPLEVALLEAGAKIGLVREQLLEDWPEEREVAFNSEVMMMATFHHTKKNGRYLVAVKGAPEAVLQACTRIRSGKDTLEFKGEDKKEWEGRNRTLAEEGLRILALATKMVDFADSDPYEDLIFVGLVGLWDPPRKEVQKSIASCQNAGVRVIMVTGDQPLTAKKVGVAVGLMKENEADVVVGHELRDPDELSNNEREHLLSIPIFARVNPKQKLDIIKLHQNNRSIVAMTGDGVNDAPALKKADIGVAMGKRGTQVAREAADMILRDDAFSSIVAAVEWGRVIFGNIRKFVIYLLSGNVSEVMIVAIALLVNSPLPLLPLQILYLNMLSDVFPALALGVGKGERKVMQRKPRNPQEPILTQGHWVAITAYSMLIAGSVLGAFVLAFTWFKMNEQQAVTVSFLSLAFARLWHVFNMREHDSKFIRNSVVLNPFVWGAILLCSALLLIAVYVPTLARVLRLVHPGIKGWTLILISSSVPWIAGQLFKHI
ncbi:MAG: cation-transporting P-type ATPase, partial [Desulfoferrobacter sp.]